jgi:hypothetical protein
MTQKDLSLSVKNSRGDSTIVHKLTEYFVAVHIRVGKFPKRDQYTIGKRIEDTTLETISLVMLARAKSGKSQLLILEKSRCDVARIVCTTSYMRENKITHHYRLR